RQLGEVLSTNVRSALNGLGPQRALPNFTSWFHFRTQSNSTDLERSLHDLRGFSHTKKWTPDEIAHNQKCEAFNRKNQRSQEISALTSKRNGLKKATEDNEDALDLVNEDLKRSTAEEKVMIRRMRKYRLFPTAEQQTKLRSFMGTCRWTYNQVVAHFRKTNVYRADVLRDLYVTKTTGKTREYPEEMGPPPDWAFDTPNLFVTTCCASFRPT
uniref:Transposase putative helix-turn-helix domain-containing protein n=1 Tax=Globisporangium ultimum (strain ATCC 200006 / CBS 805.95 / DAOM BR144) TaxID=431595 RepID=K3W9P7_GLOUD